jgi:multiple sugar transport system substrate-binding protein
MKRSRGAAPAPGRRLPLVSRRPALAVALVAATALTACGGSSSTPSAGGATSSATSAASATAAPASATAASSTGAASASAPAATKAPSAAPSAGSASEKPVACSASATKLTMWGWAAGYNLVVNEFNRTHPDICVTLQNNGAANDEYVKIGNTIKAKSGAPDIAEVEYFSLPSFEITKSLVDLTKFGVNDYKSKIAPVAWQQASQGSAVYAMPVDLGPLVQYYNSTLLKKYAITVPTTWADFATAAAKLHSADPTATLANIDPENAQAVLALMQEDNAFPFTYTGGSSVGINFTGAAETAFATYWQDLLSKKEATTVADFSPAQWANFDGGINAVRFSPAWGPVGMQLSTKKTIGAWQAAPMPQAKAGDNLSGNWGGSTVAVFAQSKHQAAAAEFAEWFGGSDAAWKILSGPIAGAFPAYLPLLNDPSFLARKLPISGDTTPNTVFATAAQHMVAPQWPPFMTAALTQWTTSFAGVTKGTTTLPDAFKNYQDAMVKYAKSQGFTVTTS